MKKFGVGCAVLGGLVVIAVLLLIFAGGGYNRLVRLGQAVDQQWAQVQNVYQRRADLVPNLVATVSGAAASMKQFRRTILELNPFQRCFTPGCLASKNDPILPPPQVLISRRQF